MIVRKIEKPTYEEFVNISGTNRNEDIGLIIKIQGQIKKED